MPRIAPAIEEDDLSAPPKRPWTRESFKAALERRYSPRLHMSLILFASGLCAMIASSSLLHLGVGSMLVRYPIAISLAYVTFLVGVWTWLRAMGFVDNSGVRRAARNLDGGDIPISGSSGGGSGGGSISLPRGGGGSFDGGGASASFAESQSTPVAFVGRTGGGGGTSKGGGFSLGDGIDGDGLVLLLLALALVAVIFATSGYLIWCAPDVLTEAAFGAALAGTLTRASRKSSSGGWVAGVVRKTWMPYAIVLVAALVFAGYAAKHFPHAQTFKQAIQMAVRH